MYEIRVVRLSGKLETFKVAEKDLDATVERLEREGGFVSFNARRIG